MNRRLLLVLLSTAFLQHASAAPAVVGTVATDIAFSTGTTITNGHFTSLTNSNYAALEGKIIVLAYYTPW